MPPYRQTSLSNAQIRFDVEVRKTFSTKKTVKLLCFDLCTAANELGHLVSFSRWSIVFILSVGTVGCLRRTSRLLHNLNESKVGIEGEWNENCLLITCRIDSVTDRDGEELPLSKILFDGYWLCEWLALITKNHTKRRIMVVAYLVTSNSSNHHEFKKKKKPVRITSVVMSTNSVFSSKEISSKEKFFIGNVRAIISFKLTPTRRISRASEHHIQHRRSILRDAGSCAYCYWPFWYIHSSLHGHRSRHRISWPCLRCRESSSAGGLELSSFLKNHTLHMK